MRQGHNEDEEAGVTGRPARAEGAARCPQVATPWTGEPRKSSGTKESEGVAGGRTPRFGCGLKTEVWVQPACGAWAAGDSSTQPVLGASGIGEGQLGLCKGRASPRFGHPRTWVTAGPGSPQQVFS